LTAAAMLVQPSLRFLASAFGSEDVIWLATSAIRFDSILFGCLLAQTWQRSSVRRLGDEFGTLTMVIAATVIVFTFLRNKLTLDIGGNPEIVLIVRNFAIGAFIVALICDKSPLCRLFNIKWIAWIGTISYSLYLWQQFFFWPTPRTVWFHWFPMNAILAFIVGVAAHFLIERPCDLLRKRI
jgi:peptidoglycan/LPS O-acetylase OafA/YrhL